MVDLKTQWPKMVAGLLLVCGIFITVIELIQSRATTAPLSQENTESDTIVVSPSEFGSKALTIDEVMGWEAVYGNLIGRDRQAAIDRFGSPSTTQDRMLTWDPSQQTSSRTVSVIVIQNKIQFIKIEASQDDNLSVLEVIKRADQFRFVTGHYTNSLRSYLLAERNNGRSAFRFTIGETQDPIFEAVIFKEADLPFK